MQRANSAKDSVDLFEFDNFSAEDAGDAELGRKFRLRKSLCVYCVSSRMNEFIILCVLSGKINALDGII